MQNITKIANFLKYILVFQNIFMPITKILDVSIDLYLILYFQLTKYSFLYHAFVHLQFFLIIKKKLSEKTISNQHFSVLVNPKKFDTTFISQKYIDSSFFTFIL